MTHNAFDIKPLETDKELFPEIKEGQKVEINWRKNDLKFACCECGLVHQLTFSVAGNKMRIRAYRDDEATEFVRNNEK